MKIVLNSFNETHFSASERIDIRSKFSGNFSRYEQHPYHIVDTSFIPVVTAFSAFILTTSIALFFNGVLHFKMVLCFLLFFFVVLCEWCIKVSNEGLQGFHTKTVLKGLKLGFILFIVSEVMFFFSFF